MAAEALAATPHWTWSVDADGIGWLGADRAGASTNVLSAEVLQSLDLVLAEVERDCPRGIIVWSAKENGFIAGADITQFKTLQTPEQGYTLIRAGQQVIDRLARLPCPTVAAIHGFALGGGLELALACHYRIALDDDSVRLGLPEVQLGVHPGFGGSVRTAQLIGARAALELMLTGQPVRARRALALGLVDRLAAPGTLKQAAVALLAAAPSKRSPPLLDRLLSLAPLRRLLAARIERTVARRADRHHYPAPYAIVDLWRRHGAHGAGAFEAEARSIAALFCTDTSRNLVRLFLLQDRLKAQSGKQTDIRKVHVIGAGRMGGDIAALCAQRGLEVTLQDRTEALIESALARTRAALTQRARSPEAAAAILSRLRADVEGGGVASADVVIEAIYESAEAKRALYATLEPQLKAGALLATNTSSLRLDVLAEGLACPERLVGLHFFNPVAKMPLVEVVHDEQTEIGRAHV